MTVKQPILSNVKKMKLKTILALSHLTAIISLSAEVKSINIITQPLSKNLGMGTGPSGGHGEVWGTCSPTFGNKWPSKFQIELNDSSFKYSPLAKFSHNYQRSLSVHAFFYKEPS